MNTKKLLNTLFMIRDINIYDNITDVVKITKTKQSIYNYLMREGITLKDFISICDYLNIDIVLHIDDDTIIDIHTLTD